MRDTTSNQFILWKVYLDGDPNEFHAIFWYLAQIAKEVHALRPTKRERRLKNEDFLLKFTTMKARRAAAQKLTREERLARSKAFWRSWVGMK